MSFRLWYYAARVLAPVLSGAVLFGAIFPKSRIVQFVVNPALYVLIALCCIGGVMGIFLAFRRLRMRCPFCGRYGRVGGNGVHPLSGGGSSRQLTTDPASVGA